MHNIRHALLVLSLLAFWYLFTGCRLDSKEILPLYKQYKFDSNIIAKLPLYDSLASAILEKYSFFEQHINEKASYRSYRYMPASEDADGVKKIPVEIAPKIMEFYSKLGKSFIYGFDVFKDSTIKIYVRRSYLDSFDTDILENLSYYPFGMKIQQREFPARDTLLTPHWQYWVLFYKPRLSF